MPCSRHLEIDFLLALEEDFAIINPPGGIDNAVDLDELIARKSFVQLALLRAVGRQGQLGVGLCRGHPVPGSCLVRFLIAPRGFRVTDWKLLDCKWYQGVGKARNFLRKNAV